MCLLVLAWRVHPDHPLIFAGNRDERHARASTPAGFWSDAPAVLAGRDLEAGGTWLGVTPSGRFAVVTNYREGLNPPKAARSRGDLPTEFLKGDTRPDEYLREVQSRGGDYGAFSLICGDREGLYWYSNRGRAPAPVTPGVHGLSNHLLDTPWPKVTQSKARLALLVEEDALTSDALFRLLADRTEAEAAVLPDTGIGQELERRVSPAFVLNPVYGTRCSTLLKVHRDGSQDFVERRFDAAGTTLETRRFHLPGAER